MAGSQAVITHDAAGQGLFVAYHPPDQHLSQCIVAYCQKVALATGLSVFVIDRAVNSLALARAFDHQDFGLLCMLDDNEHHGLESFAATLEETRKDGTKVYSGPSKIPRADDPRHFVIVAPVEGKTLVYWGTPRVKATVEPTAWPQVYRERSERQENSFKRMIDHGALNTNYGRKKIIGADRHQQRVREQLDQALETAQKRVDKQGKEVKTQQAKVVESASKGHGKRLSNVSAPWPCWKRRTKTRNTNTANSLRKLLPWDHLGSGGSRFPQTDDHDGPDAALRECADVVHGRALGVPQDESEPDCLLKLLFERAGRGWRRLPRSCIRSTPLAYRCRITACWRRSSTDCVRWTCGIRENRYTFA